MIGQHPGPLGQPTLFLFNQNLRHRQMAISPMSKQERTICALLNQTMAKLVLTFRTEQKTAFNQLLQITFTIWMTTQAGQDHRIKSPPQHRRLLQRLA